MILLGRSWGGWSERRIWSSWESCRPFVFIRSVMPESFFFTKGDRGEPGEPGQPGKDGAVVSQWQCA